MRLLSVFAGPLLLCWDASVTVVLLISQEIFDNLWVEKVVGPAASLASTARILRYAVLADTVRTLPQWLPQQLLLRLLLLHLIV